MDRHITKIMWHPRVNYPIGGCNPFIAAEGRPSRNTNLFYKLLRYNKSVNVCFRVGHFKMATKLGEIMRIYYKLKLTYNSYNNVILIGIFYFKESPLSKKI